MKTLLIVLGSLFVLSRLNGGTGLTLSLGGNAAPAGTSFTPTPPAGGAATLIPPGGTDPYANLPGGGGGAGPLPVSNGGAIGGGTGSSIHTLIGTGGGGRFTVGPGMINSRVVRTGVRTT